ncbi:MAG: signal peptidase I [Aeromicrobium sp.]
MTDALRRTKEILLTAGAIGGLVCILFALSCVVFGLTPLIVQSGSMEPTVKTGSLLITRDTPAAQLRVGQVVTVKRHDHTLVTHRIVQITHRGATASIELKGDANKVRDPEVYDVRQAGRMVVAIPFAGRVAAWMSGSTGLFFLGIYVAFLVAAVYADWKASPRPPNGGARGLSKRDASAGAAAVAGLLMLGGSLGLPVTPAPTWAAWTDSATVSTSTLSAYTVPKPVWVSCTVTGGALSQKTATIVWQEVSSPYALDYTATIRETGASMTVTDNGSTRQTQFNAGLLSTILNQSYHIDIVAKLPSPNGSWVSGTMSQQVTITLLGIGMTCDSHT